MSKRMAAKLKEIRQKLRARMHDSTKNTVKWLPSVVQGYFNYHSVPRNEDQMKTFRNEVSRMWMWQLRRRSPRSRWTWRKFKKKLGHLLPEIKDRHPLAQELKAHYPEVRFALDHPKFGKTIQGRNRCALGAPARVCAGGAGHLASLPRPSLRSADRRIIRTKEMTARIIAAAESRFRKKRAA